jgi:Icc-related predicted phosphoesterase
MMSDLHIEFFDFAPEPVPADVVVLAGDILTEHYGLGWARSRFPDLPIIYVMGNHEYYDAHYERVLERARTEAADLGIHLLENDQAVIGGVRFLGATLWTDFEVENGNPQVPDSAYAMWYAKRSMTDFRIIRYRGGILSPQATRELHLISKHWLMERLAEPFDGKTVVVTHHLPHRSSIDQQFHRNPLNPAFASHMPELVRSPVNLWIHGHTHCSCDYEPVGGTRVVCNPRGYGPSDLNEQFNQYLVVEI